MRLAALLSFAFVLCSPAGTLIGHVRDMNWYAQYAGNPFGVGYYEFAVNGNATNNSSPGASVATDIFGAFTNASLPASNYTVSSWDVWWRPAFAFNVNVPSVGNSADVDLRLRATMWGYPAFWDPTGYHEFGQTFVASGPVSMIYLRAPYNTNYTLTVRTNGPGGAAVGVSRSFSGAGDHRLIYGFGDMPTVAGSTYYIRIRTPSPTAGGVIMQMDPRPDFSDPMPGGCLWLGNGTTQTPYPDRDLGLVIMSDDDGLITDLYTRGNGNSFSGNTSVGQTFIARGVNLISAAFWLADPGAYTYVVRLLQNGPGGAPVGTTKRNKPARLGADPEMIVTWAPGECPLTAGQTYYLEVTRNGGGTFNSAYVNTGNPFPFGAAYQNGIVVSGTDLAGTIMEEQSAGSAAMPWVKITTDPFIVESNRTATSLKIQWNTDVPSDSAVEFAGINPPYTDRVFDAALATNHALLLTNLQPHTMYHFRVSSAATNYKTIVSRDIVICTRPAGSNLLANPGFEIGSGASPRPLVNWGKGGGVDIAQKDTTSFFSMPPRTGGWFVQGAVNGGSSDGYLFQRVPVTNGFDYTFSAWVTTWPRENNTLKYDVWNNQGRLIHMRLGIDPTGGTNANAGTVQWTPRMYSHRRSTTDYSKNWTQFAKRAIAQSSNLTVFIHMKGDGVQWHLYGVDDCALTHEEVPVQFQNSSIESNGVFQASVTGKIGFSNIIERSVTLTNWSPLTNIMNSNGVVMFRDTATNTVRFYRAKQ
ncbi:MAG TPA: hypothetical protein VNT99_19970 [Methylomirabilota bacterium]|nr:hypothetical protein [Methylomirabilota bacterium]